VLDLFSIDTDVDSRRDTGLCALELVESGSAHDLPWYLVCHPEDHDPATLVREGNAVFDEKLELEAGFRFFELEVLVLALSH
jgi:hypothetical protein